MKEIFYHCKYENIHTQSTWTHSFRDNMPFLLYVLFATFLYFAKADYCEQCNQLQSMIMALQQKYEDLQTQLLEKDRQNSALENRIQQIEENVQLNFVEKDKFTNLEKRLELKCQELKLQLDQKDNQKQALEKQLHSIKESQSLNGGQPVRNLNLHGASESYTNIRNGVAESTTVGVGIGKRSKMASPLSTGLTDIQHLQETNKTVLAKVLKSSTFLVDIHTKTLSDRLYLTFICDVCYWPTSCPKYVCKNCGDEPQAEPTIHFKNLLWVRSTSVTYL